MSKAAHHAESENLHVVAAKDRIYRIVSNREGKENAVSSKELARRVGLKATTVRDIIPEIRKDRNLPVASTSTGYYTITSDAEFREVMERIEETIATKQERQSELARAFYNE